MQMLLRTEHKTIIMLKMLIRVFELCEFWSMDYTIIRL